MHHIWIIEMLINDKWWPTIGCYLTRAGARRAMPKWKAELPDDKFRIRKYVREGK